MQAMSSKWLPALQADSLSVVCYGVIYGPLGSSGASVPLATIRIVSGGVTIDATNAVRRTLSSCLLVPTPETPTALPVPTTRLSDLFPDGNEIVIYKGVRYSTGATEVATLGRFLMTDVEIHSDPSSGALYIELNGSDRGETVSRAQFTTPYSTNPAQTLGMQIQNLINHQVSGLTYNLSPGAGAFPNPALATFAMGADPWQAAQGIAASCGYELFFDPFGVCTLRFVVDPKTTAPALSYADTPSLSIQISVQRSLVNTQVPNLIIVTSQGSNVTPPLRSVWWDNDPTSPTFYNSTTPPLAAGAAIPAAQGTYPTTVQTSTSSSATTQAANDAAAKSTWLAAKGAFETLTLAIRDNPAHDAEDVISVTSKLAKITAKRYVIQTITVPLSYTSPTTLKGRLVTVP